MPIPKALLLQVFFNSYFLSQPASQKDLPIASLSYGLYDFNLIFGNEECQLDAFVLQVLAHLSYVWGNVHCILILFFLTFQRFLARYDSLLLEEEELDSMSTSFSCFSFICWISFTNSIVRCFFANSAIGSFTHWLLKIILKNSISRYKILRSPNAFTPSSFRSSLSRTRRLSPSMQLSLKS